MEPSHHYLVKLKDVDGNTYSVREDTPYKVSTNRIYVAEENPNILIKVIKSEYFPESPIEDNFALNLIKNELEIAKMLSDLHFPVPHVYLTHIEVDEMHITGYIVMDRIKGRTIKTYAELKQHFDKIMKILNDLNNEGLVYTDLNIDNFIVTDENEIFLIDFGEVERIPSKLNSEWIKLNSEGIKSALKYSIKTNAEFRGGKRTRIYKRRTRKTRTRKIAKKRM